MPLPDPAAFWGAHGNGPERAGLQNQAHDRAGRVKGLMAEVPE